MTYERSSISTTPRVTFNHRWLSGVANLLRDGESLGEFVEVSLRAAVGYREMRKGFRDREQAARDCYQKVGIPVAADQVLAKMEAKFDGKRQHFLK